MIDKTILFRGNVQVELQGQNALIPVGEISPQKMTYYVGSKRSKILVIDYRQNPILAAQQVLSGLDGEKFADIFNQAAYAEMIGSDHAPDFEEIEIHLYPISHNGEFPVFWFGIIDDLKMPNVDAEWEILRPISRKKLAFATLIKQVADEEKSTSFIIKEGTYSLG
ncbi:MAG: hypothetical protein QM730_15840 [Anaerolineales bacterium]